MKIKTFFIILGSIALLFGLASIVLAETKTEGTKTEEIKTEGIKTEEIKTEKVFTITDTLPINDNKVKIINKVFTFPVVEEMKINEAITVDNLGLENKSASFFYLKEFSEATFSPEDYLLAGKSAVKGSVNDFIILTLHVGEKDYTEKYFKAFAEDLEKEASKEGQTIKEKTDKHIITYSVDEKLNDYFLLTNSVSLIKGSLVEVNKMYLAESSFQASGGNVLEEELKKALEKHSNFLKQLEDLNKD